MTPTDVESSSRQGLHFTMRFLFVIVAFLPVLLAVSGWYYLEVVVPRHHFRLNGRHIESLSTRCPSDMSPRQWESALYWTIRLHWNSLMPFEVDGPSIRDLEQRLAKKLTGDVTMDTIHWIWDEYSQICPSSERYERKFKSQMMYEIECLGGN